MTEQEWGLHGLTFYANQLSQQNYWKWKIHVIPVSIVKGQGVIKCPSKMQGWKRSKMEPEEDFCQLIQHVGFKYPCGLLPCQFC